MKTKIAIVLVAIALVGFGLFGTSEAFHSGGVAECEGCHTMHNSLGNAQMTTAYAQFATGPYLLQGTDQSSACLNCHQHAGDTGPSSYHISTADADMPAGVAPLQRTPGGDFGWLKKTYTFTVRGTTNTNHGEKHGHSIVAADYGYAQDTVLAQAPGGTYPAANFYCSSCHDPHGKYRRDAAGTISTGGLPIFNSGSYSNSANPIANVSAVGVYRLLPGNGYLPKSNPGVTFTNEPPAAVAPSTYNRSEATAQTRVAYGKGMSEWCANCHTSILQDGFASGVAMQKHPAGNGSKLGAAIIANYEAYVKSGDMTGTAAASYNSLAPFEEGVADHTIASYTQLKGHAQINDTQLGGPDANANVNCLSCHRAHATAYESMLRFPHANEFMTINDTATNTAIYPTVAQNAAVSQGLSPAEQQAGLYDRAATKFAPFQRLLCNKCHAKD